jgi:hypothetical protein
MGKTKDLGHLAHIVAYDAENHITVPAGITMHTNQLVASQAYVTTALSSYALSSALGSYVPTSRTITINGTTFDLSANRSWDITSMIYPTAGIALSTGSAWGTSITNNSGNWNTAFGWGNHASAGYLTGITSTQVTTALGFTPYNATNPAGYITGISFANVSAKPTTLAGYGITDAASSTHNHDSAYVPLGRTLTINGTTFDLSANRSWTITASGTDATKLPLAGGTLTGHLNGTSALFTGYLRTAGVTSNAVLFNAGAASVDFGNAFGQGTTNRSVYFRGNTGVSAWWGGIDGNGNNIPFAAIDAVAGEFSFWRNTGGTGGGTWSNIMTMNASGLTMNSGNFIGNLTGNSSNITAFTINQNLGTSNSPSFAGLTINTGGTGTWGPFVVTSTSQWGDGGTQYVTIGAGGAAGIMINNPHIVWNSSEVAAGVKFGRSGGVSSGSYYVIGTGASNNFFINKDGAISSPVLNINSAGNATFSGTVTAPTFNGNLSGTAGGVAWGNVSGRPGWMAAASLVEAHANANEWRNSGFYENSGGGSNWPSQTWYNSINVRHSNQGNYHGFQLAMSYYDNNLWFRSYQGSGTFQSWAVAISSQNIGSQKVDGAFKLWSLTHPNDFFITHSWTGAHWFLTSNHGSAVRVGYADSAGSAGNVSSISSAVGGSYTWTGIQQFQTNNGGQAVNNSNTAALQAFSTGNNSAFMSFHKGGHYAVNFGLDNDNVMRIGGWSASANRWQLDMSGNMTVAGDVTAFSDARVKENVETIENALDKVLALRGVSYNRNDSDDKKKKIGVIAQETLPIVPEVVNQDNDGMYNVSYGNMGGLFIEAIKEQQKKIEYQDKTIEELKELIYAITR